MIRRVCPMCVVREAGVIAPDCEVCNGHGILELGRAVKQYPDTTVSTAIHLALEEAARTVHDTTIRSRDPRAAIRATLDQLTKAGLLRPPKAPAPPGAPEPPGTLTVPPARLAHSATGRTPTRVDQNMIRAHHFPYSDRDRPGVRGLPLFSNNWHPSSLACVLDPQPFETTTPKQARSRTARNFQAAVLAEVTATM